MFKDAVYQYSNFVTAPDTVNEPDKPTILVIDASSTEVMGLASWLKTSDRFYNIYLYNNDDSDSKWFEQIRKQADVIIVNTVTSGLTPIKNVLIDLPKCWHYGTSEVTARTLNSLLDYFINDVNNNPDAV